VLVMVAVPSAAQAVEGCPPQGGESGQWSAVKGFLPFEIWYDSSQEPGVKDLATNLAGDLQGKIWPMEAGLMQTRPQPDPRPGTSGKLQICLVPSLASGDAGATIPIDSYGLGLSGQSVYVLLPLVFNGVKLNSTDLRDALAHEFFHVLQRALPHGGAASTKWWREASATWAIDFVYPGDNLEYKSRIGLPIFPKYYFATFDRDSAASSIDATTGAASYGAYVLPFYLAHTIGSSTIGAIWQQLRTGIDVPEAISNVLGSGGLRQVWQKFMDQNWNEAPFTKYRTWDGEPYGVSGVVATDTLPVNHVESLDGLELPHLSGRFFDDATTGGTRTVAFFNEYPFAGSPDDGEADRDAQVDAVIDSGGDEQVQTMSRKDGFADCESLTDEQIDRLLLIFSNSSYNHDLTPDQFGGGPPQIVTSTDGCGKWVGSFTTVRDYTDGMVEKTSGTGVTFELRAPQDQLSQYYVPTGGSITWSLNRWYNSGCSIANGTETYPATDAEMLMNLGWNEEGANPQSYFIGPDDPFSGRQYTLNLHCPDGTTMTEPWTQAYPLFTTTLSEPAKLISGDGLTISGKNTYTTSGYTDHYSWEFHSTG
jgi:hypothetical protein